MKINKIKNIGAIIATSAMLCSVSSGQASSGPAYYGAAPLEFSPLRAYYDYLNAAYSDYDYDSLDSAEDLYDEWIGTSSYYALSLYYANLAKYYASWYDVDADTIYAYYRYIGLQYFYNYVSVGQFAAGSIAYSQFLSEGEAASDPYWYMGDDVYDEYGYATDLNGAPSGLASIYAYYFDIQGY